MMNGANTLIVSWRCLKRIDIICRNGIVNKLCDKIVEEVGRGQAFSFLLDLLCVFCSQSLFWGDNTLSVKYTDTKLICLYSFSP